MALTQKRLTIKLEMSPLQLVVEVISPGKSNRDRDLNRKRSQYSNRGIPEYWLIAPESQTITVLKLVSDQYIELGQFREHDRIVSDSFPELPFAAADIFAGL